MGVTVAREFVGRGAELADLSRLLDHAYDGAGHLAVVTGEAGVGKTRLCDEFTAIARRRGARIAWVACWDAAGLPAHAPWHEALVQLDCPFPGSLRESAVDVARARIAMDVAQALRTATSRCPAVVIVDDLQWADVPSLRLLACIAPLLRSMRALVIATLRERGGQPRALPGDLRRQAFTVDLAGLRQDEVATLAQNLTGSRMRPATARELWRATAGNPLFVSELVRHLTREGRLELLATPDAAPLPPTVRAVIGERLAELTPGCLRVLEIGAVVGQEFDLGIVAAVGGLAEAHVVATLQEAVDGGIVAESQDRRHAFTHPLLRSVIRDEIGITARMRLHYAVAAHLEKVATNAPDLATLSYHLFHAGTAAPPEKVAEYAALAARAALAEGAHEAAVELFDRALGALDHPNRERLALLLGAGEARSGAGDHEGARASFLAAAAEARCLSDAEGVARAALGLGGDGFEVGLFDRVQIDLLEEALAGGALDRPSLCSRVCARLSVALSLSGADARRVDLAREAVRLAEEAGDDVALALALAAQHDAQAGPEHLDMRIQGAERIIDISLARRDRGLELLGRRLRLAGALERGDIDAVAAEVAVFTRLAEQLRQPRYLWPTRLWRGTLAVLRGRLAEQEVLAGEAEDLGLTAGSTNAPILVFTQRWLTLIEAGEIERALAHARDHGPPGSWAEWGAQMLPYAVQHALIEGRVDDARAMLGTAWPALAGLPRDSEWLTTLAHCADDCFRAGEADLAPRLYDEISPYAAMWAVDGMAAYSVGCVSRHLGMLAALLGRRDAAAAHFDAALGQHRRVGADLLVARTLLDRGTALADATALGEAADRYQALGMMRRADEARTRCAALRAEGRPDEAPRLRCEGETWTVAFAGRAVTLRDSKGMRDLATLLSRPGAEIAALVLATPSARVDEGDLGPIIDERARSAYRARLAELDAELGVADAAHDGERSARIAAERDALVQQLAGALGLGGRSRRAGATSERARTAVTARIRDGIRRIAAVNPELGRHLDRAVRTGALCCYDPEPLVQWAVELAPPRLTS